MAEKNAIVQHEKVKAQRAKWLNQVYKEHGSTAPMKLEERRKNLTRSVKALEIAMQTVQDMKKTDTSMTKEKAMGYDMQLAHLSTEQAKLEALCLIVDCLSMRITAKAKRTKKKGYYRYPAARFLSNICYEMDRLSTVLEAIAELPEEPEGKDSDKDEEEEILEVDDEELADED
jgi:hypothetical protein